MCFTSPCRVVIFILLSDSNTINMITKTKVLSPLKYTLLEHCRLYLSVLLIQVFFVNLET